jgi:DNA-binding response OmpR family regulator
VRDTDGSEPAALRLLLVENDDAAARRVEELLSLPGSGLRFSLERAVTLSDGLTALDSRGFDAVLLDLDLPDSRGIATFLLARGGRPEAAIIVLAAPADEMLALEAVRLGAQDYLLKPDLDRSLLARAVLYAIERGRAAEPGPSEDFLSQR